MEALDAAAAAAAAGCRAYAPAAFTSSDIISRAEASLEDGPRAGSLTTRRSPEMGDTSAMYAAASAAALSSAHATEAERGARTPEGGIGADDDDGTPGGAAAARRRRVRTTSSSRRGTRRTQSLTPRRQRRTGGRRNFLGTGPVASIAAKIAARRVRAKPGSAPETVAKQVAAAMLEALERRESSSGSEAARVSNAVGRRQPCALTLVTGRSAGRA